LFTYERLRDVRIVYVPPLSLGNFGGDTDNFEWPRHTADFTLLRAYVSPSGASSAFSASNVPYNPRRHLQLSPSGASPGDFVFLLGFPGSTMRYAPSCRLLYSDAVAVPQLLEDFGTKIELMKQHTLGDRQAGLKVAAAIKSLSNELKRSRGKRVMMRKLALLRERSAEEAQLCRVAPQAEAILQRLQEIYNSFTRDAEESAALEQMRGVYHGSTWLAVAHAVHEAQVRNPMPRQSTFCFQRCLYQVEASKPESDRMPDYCVRNIAFLAQRLSKRITDLHPPLEAALITRALARAGSIKIPPPIVRALELAVEKLPHEPLPPLLQLSAEELKAIISGSKPPPTDAAFEAARAIFPVYSTSQTTSCALLSERDKLLAQLLDLQRIHTDETFYPDANGCLRLSAGHVEGYSAADAVFHHPVTTVSGLIDKHVESRLTGSAHGEDEFACPERLLAAADADARVGATPACICYSTDTGQ
jgi:hypothetical protein